MVLAGGAGCVGAGDDGRGLVKAPQHLDARAADVWRDVYPTVEERFQPGDEVQLAALCVQIVRLRDAQARIDAEGLIVLGGRGQPMQHPAIPVERDAGTAVRALAQRFGLDPASRKALADVKRAPGRPIGAVSSPDRAAITAGAPPAVKLRAV